MADVGDMFHVELYTLLADLADIVYSVDAVEGVRRGLEVRGD